MKITVSVLIKAFIFVFLLTLLPSVFVQGAEKDHRTYPENIALTSYMIKEGDTLWNLFKEDWTVVARINRISPDTLKAGMIVMVPLDMEEARRHSPLPYDLPYESREEKIVFVNLKLQALGLYQDGTLLEWMPISSGKDGHPTPRGEFRVNRKVINHLSRTHPKPTGGAPMPYALRFITPYYWIHEGSLPGYPASKGCVRLMKMDALILYHWAEIGTLIVIV